MRDGWKEEKKKNEENRKGHKKGKGNGLPLMPESENNSKMETGRTIQKKMMLRKLLLPN